MNKKQIFLIICVLLAAAIFYFTISFFIAGEKEKIKRIIFATKKAIEKEDALRVVDCVSFDYQDKYGNSRGTILLICRTIFNEYQDIALTINELKIELNQKDAQALMEVYGLARKTAQEQTNQALEAETIKFKAYFRKENGEWKVIQLEFLQPEQPFPVIDSILLSRNKNIANPF